MAKRAVFLDRDGTLVKALAGRPANTPDELELLPTVAEGMRLLVAAGYTTILVTNQGGIALGYMTNNTMFEMNERLNDLLIVAGAEPLSAMYWCPHDPRGECDCRKPRPGMLLNAAKDLGISLKDSHIIGDDVRDVEAGIRAGLRRRHMVVSDMYKDPMGKAIVFPNFVEAARAIVMIEEAA